MNTEFTNTESDDPDPLKAAFDNYQPSPKDVVPRGEPTWQPTDLAALAGQPVTVTHLTEDGPVTENVTITAPVTREDN